MAFEQKKIVLKSNGKSVRDFIFSGDVAEVVEKSLYFKKSETYNLGSGKSISMLEIAKLVQEAYFEMYGVWLEIITNKNDKSEHKKMIVKTSKLKELVDVNFKPRFKKEIKDIFKLLEKRT